MIKVRQITLVRAEGFPHECDKPVICKDWAEANTILFKWSYTAPLVGYDKCDFFIEFEDGETYKGRYDLVYYKKELPDLVRHIRSLQEWLAIVERKDINSLSRNMRKKD